jgi:glycolate oxidase
MYEEEGDRPFAEKMIDEIIRSTIRLGGTISGEHGIGNVKSKFLPLEIAPQELQIMKDIKRLFDPKGILNPGKFF